MHHAGENFLRLRESGRFLLILRGECDVSVSCVFFFYFEDTCGIVVLTNLQLIFDFDRRKMVMLRENLEMMITRVSGGIN